QPVAPYMDEIVELLADCPYRQLHVVAWTFRAWNAADGAQAAACLERALQLSRTVDESPRLAAEFGALADPDFCFAILNFGYAALLSDQGELARAAGLATESLRLFRVRGNRNGIGESLSILGRVALLQGALPQAETFLREAAAIAAPLNLPAWHYDW